MKPTKALTTLLLLIVLICSPVTCLADLSLGLRTEFVKQVKDRATLTTTFNVDGRPGSPHSVGEGSNDGDVHLAGRDTVVLLPLVVEIVNARMENDTWQFLKQLTLGTAVDVTGVWRIWFEHPGTEPQVQGDDVPAPDNSNPDHVFELHPVTSIAGFDCLDSFLPIVNPNTTPPRVFKAYDAVKAFEHYEGLEVSITRTATGITITAGHGKLNYADFVMKLAGKPKEVADGYIVPAKILEVGTEDDFVVGRNRRMIFSKGSEAADIVKDKVKNDTLHVLGIPRVNLNKVYAIAQNLAEDDEFIGPLPYEMIIVAVLEDEE